MLELFAAVALMAPAPRVMPERVAHPGVFLSDADGFAVDAITAREYWQLADRHIKHHRQHILDNYPFPAYMGWVTDAQKCRAAWDTLDNLTWPTMDKSPEYRLAQLRRLREILGEEDYAARRMPPPCPGWMFVD